MSNGQGSSEQFASLLAQTAAAQVETTRAMLGLEGRLAATSAVVCRLLATFKDDTRTVAAVQLAFEVLREQPTMQRQREWSEGFAAAAAEFQAYMPSD